MFLSDVLRWASKWDDAQSILENKHDAMQNTANILFVPAFATLSCTPHAWTNGSTPELTANMAYLCHSGNWNRATLIGHAGCDAIKT